jgi:hypothetical protein
VDQQAADVVEQDGGDHQEQVNGLAPAVEDQAGDQQHGIAQFLWQDVVQRQHNGQVCK